MTFETIIASDLLKIKAVSLKPNDPFTWASGIKSPIYCDNRVTISYPAVRKQIVDGFVELINKYYPEAEVIAGTATAGIPHAAFIAMAMDLPMVYIRTKPKDHGTSQQIEGYFESGAKMVVIDDLISTGGSVLSAVSAAKKEGATVIGVASIFSYELPQATLNFGNAKLPFHALTNYSALIKQAEAEKFITTEEHTSLQKWREDPENWLK